MTPYSSFQLPDAWKPFLGQPPVAEAMRQQWLHGCERVQESWIRSNRDLVGHCNALLREGRSLQTSVLGHYFEWVRNWTRTPFGGKPAAAKKPETETTDRSTEPAQSVPTCDDLTRIKGVGRAVQQRLNNVGVVSFRQIASWTDTEIAYIENNVLGGAFAGCVSREQWQAQARDFLASRDN